MMRALLHRFFVGLAMVGLAVPIAHAQFRDFDAKSLAQIRAANAGRPFILALWSIHCEPCRHEMSQWGPLRRRYPGIPIVLVATDLSGERPLLEEFLSRHDLAGIQSWAFADEFEARVRYSIDPKWRGELPRTYLFDADHRAEGRSGPADLAWVVPWIERQAKPARRSGSAGRHLPV